MSAAHPIRVVCDDLDVADWFTNWVESMRLAPPVPLVMHLHLVRTLPPDGDTREPFRQPSVEIRSGPPLGDVRIRWRRGEAQARVPARAPTAAVQMTPAALSNRERFAEGFLSLVLIFLLRRAGWHHVHAAVATDPEGRDWLFAGNAEAGKSTTAALLATRGWAVGNDDSAFLFRNGTEIEARSQRAPITLRDGGYALLGLEGGASARGGRKKAFYPEELGGSWTGRVRPSIIALPRVGGGVTRMQPVRAVEALAELVRWSAWVMLEPELAEAHLDMLTQLALQTRCYRLVLGPDLFGARDLLLEMVS